MDRDRERVRLSVQGAGGGPLTVRRLLLASFLALTAFLVVGQILIMNRGLEREFLEIQKRELRRELELAPLFLESLQTEDPDSASRALAARIGYPVTLLDHEGRVIGASSDLPFQLRGMLVSPESVELAVARVGDVGFSRRRGSGEVEVRLFAATPATVGSRDLLLQVAIPLDEVRRAVRGRIWSTLGLAFPALVLALGLTALVGGLLNRPLQTLARRSRRLSAGDFSRRIPATVRVKELADLAGTFNRMTEELAVRFRSLEAERNEMQTLIDCMGEAVIALTDDARILTANKAAIDLLDFPDPVNFAPVGALVRQPALRVLMENAVIRPFSSKEVALGDRSLIVSSRAVEGGGAVVTFVDVTETRRIEMVRRDFVANASHELKTPLTAMRGFAETLMEDDLPEELRRDWLNSIRTNTIRLQRLVDDLLDLSRLESGGWVAREEVVEVRPLVEDILAGSASAIESRELSVQVRGSGLVLADAQGLEQVLKNLVDNAVRYSPAGETIRISIREADGTIRIVVEDKGPGIPTPALNRIFERFYRVDPARSREEGGTGLGLAIVRHLVNAMGGHVWAESELGQGTRINVTLPLFRDPDEEGFPVEEAESEETSGLDYGP